MWVEPRWHAIVRYVVVALSITLGIKIAGTYADISSQLLQIVSGLLWIGMYALILIMMRDSTGYVWTALKVVQGVGFLTFFLVTLCIPLSWACMYVEDDTKMRKEIRLAKDEPGRRRLLQQLNKRYAVVFV